MNPETRGWKALQAYAPEKRQEVGAMIKTVRVARFEEELLKWGLSGLAWDAVKRVIQWGLTKLRRKPRLARPTRVVTVRETVHVSAEVTVDTNDRPHFTETVQATASVTDTTPE